MPTVAEIVARTIKEAGIEIVFGLPGGENTEVLDAIRREGIRFELVTNESSAVFMADATARLTRKPGGCLTTLGPGATNAVAGVAHAYLDRAPVLVITAQTPEYLLSHYTHQVVDLQALFTPITKASFKMDAQNVRQIMNNALDLTMQGRPGPVHIAISNEAAGEIASDVAMGHGPVISEKRSPSFSPADIAAARELLAQSKRPVIVAGLGLEPEAPYAALRELAESLPAPVITLPKAKGSLPADHPLAAGTIGLTHADPAYEILDEADCILAVGFDVVELVKPWQQTAPLIWIAPWPNDAPHIAAELELVGPMLPVLQQLADVANAVEPEWGQQGVAAWRKTQANQPLPEPSPGRILPQTILRVLRQYTPRETMLVTDVGSHKIFYGLEWPAVRPNRYLLSNGLSCMGFSLPAAIAASLVLPNQPTLCITGDAGLAMVLGELGVLARLQTPVIIVVMNDNALDLIRSAQVRRGKPAFGVEFTSPDFAAIAAAYGIESYKVSNESECTQAIQSAVAAGQPALIEAMIDPVSYPTTPRR
jgi:acetolactate synthase-1/2/3 large subunit